MFTYTENRLPHQLSSILWRQNLFWVKELKYIATTLNIFWPEVNPSRIQWINFSTELSRKLKSNAIGERLTRKN